jgi:hypothetical protein
MLLLWKAAGTVSKKVGKFNQELMNTLMLQAVVLFF